ncbi:MAG: response regulator [Candidatus Poseidonia sp.]|nr:response regulator [Poseidonia sp.]MBL6747652.1 response regulator [Poseidonia sp.]MBL6806833.1 response regulator [Poseidonia sp.]
MGLVTEVDDEGAPTVLIVDNNPMSSLRLSNLFKARNFIIEHCEDGDQAVDEYIRLDPELVVLSLDIPSLDGHLAALEMREHGGEQRIVFVAPARMADVANDAAFSAGAVAWLQKPISNETLESQWRKILGRIPDAPGLEDLDELYPGDRVKPEADEGPMPGLPLPLPMPVGGLPLPLPELVVAEVAAPVKKKSRKKWVFALLILAVAAAGAAYGLGYISL